MSYAINGKAIPNEIVQIPIKENLDVSIVEFSQKTYYILPNLNKKQLYNFFGQICFQDMNTNLLICSGKDLWNIPCNNDSKPKLSNDAFTPLHEAIFYEKPLKVESCYYITTTNNLKMFIIFQKGDEGIVVKKKDTGYHNDKFKDNSYDVKYDKFNNKILLISKGFINIYDADEFYKKNINANKAIITLSSTDKFTTIELIPKNKIIFHNKDKVFILNTMLQEKQNETELKIYNDKSNQNEVSFDVKQIKSFVCFQDKLAMIYAEYVQFIVPM